MPSGALDGIRLHLVQSLDDAMAAKQWAGRRREGPLFFDTESGGLNPHRDRHRLTQLGDLNEGWAFPPGWAGVADEILSTYEGELGAHNSPYDWRVLHLHRKLAPQWHRTHDTLIGGHLADSVRPAALKPRAALEIDSRALRGEAVLDAGMKKQHWTWDSVPDDWEPYWTYGALDPVLAAHLWRKFSPEIRRDFATSYDLERATLRICGNMMLSGMMIDRAYIRRNISERLAWRDEAMAWLRGVHGVDSVESNAQVGRALNMAGVPTMAWTDGGQPSISKETLKLCISMFPHAEHLIRTIAAARKTGKVCGSYLGKFLELAGSDDIMHYTIWSSKARTSRMSVTEPPMQTYDRDEPVVRGSYVPRPGHVFITIDADQIEARLAAHFSGDERMIADFIHADATGQKFFVIMAGKIFGQPVAKSDPRYTHTKNATYGQIYGAGLDTVAATAGVPLDQMRPVYTGFQQLYPGVARLMGKLIKEGRYGGGRPQVRTLYGRRLYADRGHEYALLNYLIQGSAAEIMKRGLVNLEAAGFGPYLRLAVHDEVIIEAPEEYAEEMLRVATEILTDRVNFRVPITWAGNILRERWVKC